MRVLLLNNKQNCFRQFCTLLFFAFSFLYSTNIQAQCNSGPCELCNAVLTVGGLSNGTVVTGTANIAGTIGPSGTGVGSPIVIDADGCGAISMNATVSFTWWQGTSNSWLHGVSFASSPGWTAAQGNNPGAGWLFLNSITGDCAGGGSYGAGFYWDAAGDDGSSTCQTAGDVPGDPSDNFGINPSSCCPTFTFSLEFCPASGGTATEAITFQLTEDGTSGGWSNSNSCDFDLTFPITVNSAGTTLDPITGPVCAGEAVTLNAGSNCSFYDWGGLGPNSPAIQIFPTTSMTYCVTASSGIGCQTVACTDVIVQECCAAMAGTVTTDCAGGTPNATVTDFNPDPTYSQMIILVDAGGTIVETIFGSAGTFSVPIGAGYNVYSYNFTSLAAGCTFPLTGTPISIVCTSMNSSTCAQLAGPTTVTPCCTAMAGSISATPMTVCPSNGMVTATAAGFDGASTQTVFMVDPAGIITDVAFGASGSFSVTGATCPSVYQVCSYNFGAGAPIPLGGNPFSALNCAADCCDIICTTIDVADNDPPVFQNQPPSASIECPTDIPPAENITWTDVCDGTGVIMPMESGTADCTGGTIIRSWTYTDACGNATFHSQVIQVTGDLLPPVFDNPPPSAVVSCVAEIPTAGDLTWTDNCDGAGSATMIESSTVAGCAGGTVTRTWDATDACGNFTQHVQVIQVQPVPPAMLQNAPVDMVLSCGAPFPGPPAPLNYDNGLTGLCADSGMLPGNQIDGTNGCSGGTITNTWMGTDNCGNPLSHTQTITIPASPPGIIDNLPPDMVLACDAIIDPIAPLTYNNNDATCPDSGPLPGVQVNNVNGCMGGMVTNTWTGMDACGNVLTHTQTLTVPPTPMAMFVNPPQDMTLTCDATATPPDPLMFDNGDGTCPNTGTIPGTQVDNTSGCMGGTIVNTWTGMDACGNPLTYSQTLTVPPTPMAMFVNPPQDMTLTCDATATPPDPLMFDNGDGTCPNTGTIPGTQVDNTSGCMGGTIVNTWTGMDACGNPLTYSQTLTVPPTPMAMFVNPPQDMTLTCDATATPPDPLMFDNSDPACPNTGTIPGTQVDNTSGCMGGTIVNTWTGMDACGNPLTYSQTLTVPPTPMAMFVNPPQDMTLTCDATATPPDPLMFDNSDPACPNTGTIPGTQVDNTSGCMGGTIVNTWTGMDACGNPLTYSQTLTVPPTPMAMFVNPPQDMTLTCDATATPPDPLMFDNSDPACPNTGTIPGTQVDNTSGCMGGTIVNTWTGMDACGNPLTYSQTLTVPPTPIAMFVNPPPSTTIACGDPIPPLTDLNFDNGDPACPNTGMISGTMQDNSTGCAGGSIVYTWTGNDNCMNPLSHTQTITITPPPMPIIQNPPGPVTIECGEPLPSQADLMFDNGVTGTCANSGTLPISVMDNSDACGGSITYTWTGPDACGMTLTHSQTITVNPAPAATFQNLPADMTIVCGDPVSAAMDLTYDNGLTGTCANTGTIPGMTVENYDACGGTITTTWTGIDACGNPLNHTQTITVDPAPAATLQNLPGDMTIACGDVLPALVDLMYDNGLTGNCANSGTIPGMMQDNSDPCLGGSITYTWTGVDACGNPLNHTQTFTVTPAPLPTIQNPPGDMNMACGDMLPTLVDLMYDNGLTGNCANSGTIPGSVVDNSDPCTGGTVVYTWTGQDDCGNPLMHIQTITVTPAPIATLQNLPADQTLACGDPLPGLVDLMYDNGLTGGCANSGSIPGTQSGTVDPCTGGTITYTWTGTDDCSNPLSHTQTFTFTAAPIPTFTTMPASLNLTCGDNIPPLMDLTYDNGLTGACQITGQIIGVETGMVDACNGGTITYTWDGQDQCGNPLLHVQTISVTPAPPATFVSMPADMMINCGDALPILTDLQYDNGVTGVCQNAGTIVGMMVDNSDACNGGTVVYTWDGQDDCGNPLVHTQTITVAPAMIPTLQNPPMDMMINCGDMPPALVDIMYDNGLTGNCSIAGTIPGTMEDNTDGCTGGNIIYTWTGADDCGNPLMHTQTITVAPAPLATLINPPTDMAINCGDAAPPVLDISFDNNLTGVCANAGTIPGTSVENFDACGGTITNTWTGADACGNPLMHIQTITVNPAPPAMFVNTPADAVINCGDPLPTSMDLTFDNNITGTCANTGTIAPVVSDMSDPCTGGTITYTWSGADNCGNPLNYVQTVTMTPAPAATFVSVPPDAVIDCGDPLPPLDPLAFDNNEMGFCANAGTIPGTSVENFDACGGTITYTWSGVDNCGNPLNHIQNITVNPAAPATFVAPPTDIAINCGDVLPSLDPLMYDNGLIGNCANTGTVPGVMNDLSDPCVGGIITYIWSGQDQCGNPLNHTQTITVSPAPLPTIQNPPADIAIDCGDPLPSLDPLTFDNGLTGNCQNTGPLMGSMNDMSDPCTGGTITYTWVGVDNCGNPLSHVQTITVSPAPLPTIPMPADVSLTCGEPLPPLMPLTFDNGLTGGCQNMGTIPGVMDDQSNPCTGGMIIYTWTGADNCGNPLTHTQTITLSPPPPAMLTSMPADLNLQCGDPIPPLTDLMYDNGETGICQITGVVPGIQSGIIDPCTGGTLVYSWSASDACGNLFEHTQTINVAAPAIAMFLPPLPADMTLQCGDPIPPLAGLPYDNGATGQCQNAGTIPGIQSGVVDPCIGGVLIYTWNGVDACGNPLVHTQTITVEAAPQATFVNLPLDVTLNCGDPFPTLTPLIYDNGLTGQCQITGTVNGIQVGILDPCVGGIIQYLWDGIDQCGNPISHTQNITVNPTGPADFLFPPTDITIACGDPIPPLTDLQYDNGIAGLCQNTGFLSGTEVSNLDACFGGSIIYTWAGADNCGNPLQHIQTITISPAPIPTFVGNLPQDITLNCGDPLPQLVDLQYDNQMGFDCQITGVIPGVQNGFPDPCLGGVVSYEWIGADACGNPLQHIQLITFNPPPPPQFLFVPPNITVECTGIPPAEVLQYDNGGVDLCNISGAAIPIEIDDYGNCPRTILRIWEAINPCTGESISVQQTVTVDDPLPPFMDAPPSDITICEGELPESLPLFWTDNCDGVGFAEPVINSDGNNFIVTWNATDLCGNNTVASQFISVSAGSTVIIDGPDAICEGNAFGIPLCAIGDYVSYFWNTGEQTECITPTQGGLYTVSAIDINGCEAFGEFDLPANPSPEAIITGDLAICSGEATTLMGEGSINYFWNGPAGLNTQGVNMITVSTPGTYCLTVVDGIGCSGETCVIVTEDDAPVITIDGETEICDGQTATLTASGAGNYTWTTDQGMETGPVINVTTSQTVTVTGESGNGCVGTQTHTVTVNPNPMPEITGVTSICDGQTAVLTLTDTNYDEIVWSTTDTGPTTSVTTAQTVSVTVTLNGCTGTDEINVEALPNPEPVITGSLTYCAGGSTTLDAGAGYDSYIWTTATPMTTQTINVTAPGQYCVTVMLNGCSGDICVDVTESTSLEPSLSGDDFCAGSSTTLDAGGGFTTYEWSANAGGGTGQTVTVSAAGTYMVTVGDGSCSGVGSITVAEIPNPVVNLGDDISECGGNDVTLDAGSGFASYLWSNSSVNSTFVVTTDGTYCVTVTDMDGCTGEDCVDVTFGNAATPTITGDLDICEGETTTLDAGVYASYMWSTGSTDVGQTIDVTTAGQYTVTVTDASGCTATNSVIVNVTTITTPPILGNTDLCAGETTTLTASGTYDSYTWTPGGMGAELTNVGAGTYTVEVSVNGCSTTNSITVTETPSPMPVITGAAEICAGTSTNLDAGNGYATYNWSNLGSGQTITATATDTYCVTVTDGNGCTGEDCFDVLVVPAPMPSIIGDDFCEGDNTTLTATAGFDSYVWSAGVTGTGNVVTVDESGTYSVTVTDGTGCTGVAQINITENIPEPVTIGGSTTFCTGSSTTLSVPGGLFQTVTWTPGGTGTSISVSTPGPVSVETVDFNGCISTASVMVTESDGLEPVITGTDFCDGGDTELDAGVGFSGYIWSIPNQNGQQTVTVSSSGTYSVTVSDATGCTGIGSITITEFDPVTPTIMGDDICEGESTTLTVSPSYTSYVWSDANMSINESIEVTTSGEYCVTVTDANGCMGEDCITITVNPLPQPELGANQSICTDQNVILNPGTFFSYSWDTPDGPTNSGTVIADVTGTYSVTVSDAAGCTATDEMTLTVQDNLLATITGDTEFCQGSSTTICVDETFDTYIWSGGNGATQCIDVSLPGNYSVVVSDENGCTGTADVAVIQNTNPEPSIAGSTTFCTGTTTTLDAGMWTSYMWSNSADTQTIEVDVAGQYCVTVTDENGCTGSTCVDVTESTSLEPNISGEDFCEGETTTLDAGAGFSAYLWDDAAGSTTQTITVDASGTYCVTVTNLSGCSGSGCIDITENPNPNLDLGDDQTICEGESVTLDAGANFASYLWLPSGEVTQTIEVSSTTTVTATVTTAEGCSATDEIIITVEPLPTPQIGGSTTFCTGTSTTLDAGAGYTTYEWSTGASTQTIPVDMEGEYCVTVTDANGCTGTDCVMVTESTSLMPVITGSLEFCFGDNTTLDAGAGFDSYLWNTTPPSITRTITVEEGGTYSVTVSDMSGCTGVGSVDVIEGSEMNPMVEDMEFCDGEMATLSAGGTFTTYFWTNAATTETITVTGSAEWCVTVTNEIGCTAVACGNTIENPNPIPIISGSTTFCTGTSTTIDAGDGYTVYVWDDGTATQTYDVSAAGTYCVTVTDENGCTGTDCIDIIEDSSLNPVIVGDLLFCFDESTSLTAGPGFASYTWSPNGETDATITASEPGVYSVTVTDESGCSGENSVTVEENPEIILDITGDDTFCFGETTTLDAGAGYTTYLWSDGSTMQTVVGDNSFNWCVTVTDDAGCTAEDCIQISESPEIIPEITGSTTFCIGTSTTLTANGGSASDTYLWSNDETTQEISVSAAGEYCVTITNSFGCTASTCVTVTESTSLNPQIGGDLDFCDGENSVLDAGAGFDMYLWDDAAGSTTQTITVDASGTYSVTVTDVSGCSGSNSVDVTEHENPVVDLGVDIVICSGESQTLDAGAGSGTVTFDTYQWSNAVNTQTQTVTIPGTYCVTVTTAAGCTTEDCINVEIGDPVQPTIGGSTTFCTGTTTTLDAGVWTSYEWSPNNEDTQTIIVDMAGEYCVTVTDENGCTGSICVMVNESTSLEPNITGEDFCEGGSSILDAGSGFAMYQWDDVDASQTQTITVTEPGIYNVTVTGLSGCSGTGSIEIFENPNPIVDLGDDIIICVGETAILDADAGAGFTYSWSTSSTNPTIEVSVSNTYSVTVTETATGCIGTDEIVVTIENLPQPNIEGSTSFCTGTSTTLDAGSGFSSYAWSTGSSEQIIIVDTPGQYCVTVTNAAGCENVDCVDVTESSSLSPVIGGIPEFCFDESTTLDVGAGFATYEWSVTGETSQTLVVTESGTYSVTVSDVSGCTGEASIDVIEGEELLPEITGNLIYCGDETTTLDAGAGFAMYQWSNAADTQTIEAFGTGTWCVTVTDAIGCTAVDCVDTQEVQNPTPSIQGSTTFCTGTSTTLDAGTGYAMYQWDDANNTAMQTLEVNVAGTYCVTVTDDIGCTGEACITVNESSELSPTIGGDPIFCTGSSTTLDAGAGFTDYEWQPGGFTTQTIEVSTADTYTLTVMDASGCSGTATIDITEETPSSAGMGSSIEQCPDEASVVDLAELLTEEDTGGTWTANAMNPSLGGFDATNGTFDPLSQPEGTYTFDYTTPAGTVCPADVESVTVVINEQPIVNIDGVSILTCAINTSVLNSDGSSTGGTYLWEAISGGGFVSTDLTMPTVEIGAPGTYQLTIDINGCTSSNTYSVTAEAGIPAASIATPEQLTCDFDPVLLDLTTDAANPSFAWTGPNGTMGDTEDIMVSAAGTYSCLVTDGVNGCEITTSIEVLAPDGAPDVSITAEPSGILNCTIESILLEAILNGTNTDVSYQWYLDGVAIEKANNPQLQVSNEGDYSVIVTDNVSGCEGTEEQFVGDLSELPSFSIPTPDVLTCVVMSVDLNIADVVTGSDDVTFEWTGPNGMVAGLTSSITVSEPGIYTVVVEDVELGCINSDTVEVLEDTNDPIANATGNDIGCDDNNTTLDGSSSENGAGGSTGLSYTWTDASGGNIGSAATTTVTQAGTYNLLVTDDGNGCTDETAIEIMVSNAPQITAEFTDSGCEGTNSGSIIADATEGMSPYMYSLGGNTGFGSSNVFEDLAAGIYTVIVQDANGCEDATTITIEESDGITVDLGFEEVVITPGAPTQLEAIVSLPETEVDSIVWSPATGLDDPTILSPTATVTEETTYSITVYSGGCSDTDQITLYVDVEVNVYVPSAFSPNNDGINDFFNVYASEGIDTVQLLRVYDRWGNHVYEAFDFAPNQVGFGWDGTFRGEELDPAVFVWYAEIIMPNGRAEIFEGDVTIMR